jgi:hypothetical protein
MHDFRSVVALFSTNVAVGEVAVISPPTHTPVGGCPMHVVTVATSMSGQWVELEVEAPGSPGDCIHIELLPAAAKLLAWHLGRAAWLADPAPIACDCADCQAVNESLLTPS